MVRQLININSQSCLQCSLEILWVIINLQLGVIPSIECCMLCSSFLNVEELVLACGAKILLPDDPANPQKCTIVQGIVWNLPKAPRNHFHLTMPDRKEAKTEDQGEGEDEKGEDEGEVVEDRNNETEKFHTSKEAICSYGDKGFRFKHTDDELCHAICFTGCPLKCPCGPCPALSKVHRNVASNGQWYVNVVTPHTDDCSHRTEFKVSGSWLCGVFGKSLKQSTFNTEKPPWKSPIYYRRRSSCALLTPATASQRKYVGICKGLVEKMGGGHEHDNAGVGYIARCVAKK